LSKSGLDSSKLVISFNLLIIWHGHYNNLFVHMCNNKFSQAQANNIIDNDIQFYLYTMHTCLKIYCE